MGRGNGENISRAVAGQRSFRKVKKKIQNRYLLKGIDDVDPDSILRTFVEVSDADSPENVAAMQDYLRARTGRRELRLQIGHESGSYTDMNDLIVVDGEVPPESEDEVEKAICMQGLLRHEACHIDYTDAQVFDQMKKDFGDVGETIGLDTAETLHKLWNMLEDGMIEWRELRENIGSYNYIAALNRLHPRIDVTTVQKDRMVEKPDGYYPTDADGNRLKVSDGKVLIPAGTRTSVWGEKPISKYDQALFVSLAAALPGFEPGDLHPDVAAAFEEMKPYIAAAVEGNTADCVASAYSIHAILKNHNLLPPERRDPQWQQEMKDRQEEMRQWAEDNQELLEDLFGTSGPSEPQVRPSGNDDKDGEKGPSAPMNPMPSVPGEVDKSEEMQVILVPAPGGDSGEEGEPQGGGGAESSDTGDISGSANGNGEDGDEEDEGDSAAGKSGNGEDDPDSEISDSQADGGDEGSGSEKGDSSETSSSSQRSETTGGNNRTPDKPDNSDVLSNDEFNQLMDTMRDRMTKTSSNADQHRKATVDARTGIFEGSSWTMPDGSRVENQKDLARRAKQDVGSDTRHLRESTQRQGRVLGKELEKLRAEMRAPTRYQKMGRIDKRRFSAALAGNDRVFYRPGVHRDTQLELDITIDRSGSVTCNSEFNEGQLRMAKMFGHAAQTMKIPTTIYGFSGGFSNCDHFAFKEKHSRDLNAIDALKQTGGGGTPTGEAIEFSRARLSHSDADHRIMVVVTDGAANDTNAAREQVEAAKAEGVTVVGVAFECRASDMDEQFGTGNWVSIDDYEQAPKIIGRLISKLAKSPQR